MTRPSDGHRSRRYEVDPTCRCGCPRETHEHYRDATDCGYCGRQVCPEFVDARLSNLDLRDQGRAHLITDDYPPMTGRDRLVCGAAGLVLVVLVAWCLHGMGVAL